MRVILILVLSLLLAPLIPLQASATSALVEEQWETSGEIPAPWVVTGVAAAATVTCANGRPGCSLRLEPVCCSNSGAVTLSRAVPASSDPVVVDLAFHFTPAPNGVDTRLELLVGNTELRAEMWIASTSPIAVIKTSQGSPITIGALTPNAWNRITLVVVPSAGYMVGRAHLDGATPSAYTTAISFPPSAGLVTVRHHASRWSSQFTGHVLYDDLSIVPDIDFPVVSIAHACPNPGLAGWCKAAIPYTMSATDATSGIRTLTCREDGVVMACSRDVVQDGLNVLSAVAVDAAGRSNSTSANVYVDRAAPFTHVQTTCLLGSSGWCIGSVDFRGSASDGFGSGIASTTCALDNATSECVVTATEEGGHMFKINASDVAGHSSSASASRSVDLSNPTITWTITGPPGDNGWYRGATNVTLACADAVSGVRQFEVRIGSGAFAPYAGPYTFDDEGTTVVRARCFDVAGRTTDETRTIDIDSIPPEVSFTTPAYAAAPYGVSWSANDATSGLARLVIEEAARLEVLEEGTVEACIEEWAPLPTQGSVSGACARDPPSGIWCYGAVVRDVAGNERSRPFSELVLTDREGSLGGCTLKLA